MPTRSSGAFAFGTNPVIGDQQGPRLVKLSFPCSISQIPGTPQFESAVRADDLSHAQILTRMGTADHLALAIAGCS